MIQHQSHLLKAIRKRMYHNRILQNHNVYKNVYKNFKMRGAFVFKTAV